MDISLGKPSINEGQKVGFLLGQVENHRTGLLATQQDCWKNHSSDGRFTHKDWNACHPKPDEHGFES